MIKILPAPGRSVKWLWVWQVDYTPLYNPGDDGTVELLALVHLLSRIDHHTQIRAEQLLADLQTRLSEARFAALQARGKALQLGDVIAELLAEGEAR